MFIIPQEQNMKHIVDEMQDNKDNKPQGVHMPGATKSYNSLQAQTAIENCTGHTTCPTISIVIIPQASATKAWNSPTVVSLGTLSKGLSMGKHTPSAVMSLESLSLC